MIRRPFIAALGLGLACLPSARADVIFNDFAAGDTYNTTIGYTVAGANTSAFQTSIDGSNFTAGVTAKLSEIDVAFSYIEGSGKFNLGLYADDGTGHVGALIESYQNIGPVPNNNTPGSFTGSVIPVSSALHPLLTAGVSYWLIASPADSGSYVVWNENTTGATGTHYASIGSNILYYADTLPTFRLIGASVPEPSSLALLGLGVVAGAIGLRGRRPARP